MGSDVITVDFDGVLTEEQLYDVEQEANEGASKCSGCDQLSVKGRAGNHGLPEQKEIEARCGL